jgi:hypothetical protein
MRSRSIRLLVVASLLLIASCSSDQPATDAAASASLASASEPGPASSAADGAAELEATGSPLPAGRYTKSGFSPTVTLALNGDWQAVQDASGFFDIQQRVDTPEVIAVQFANVLEVYGEDGAAAPADHADAAAILGGNSDFTVLGESESRIGGLTGSLVEIENAGDTHASVLQVPPGALGIDPGRRLWIAFFDTDDGVVAIMVGGSVAEWQAALDAAEPVLESIEIGD